MIRKHIWSLVNSALSNQTRVWKTKLLQRSASPPQYKNRHVQVKAGMEMQIENDQRFNSIIACPGQGNSFTFMWLGNSVRSSNWLPIEQGNIWNMNTHGSLAPTQPDKSAGLPEAPTNTEPPESDPWLRKPQLYHGLRGGQGLSFLPWISMFLDFTIISSFPEYWYPQLFCSLRTTKQVKQLRKFTKSGNCPSNLTLMWDLSVKFGLNQSRISTKWGKLIRFVCDIM